MQKKINPRKDKLRLYYTSFFVFLLWSAILTFLYFWNDSKLDEHMLELAKKEAQANFNKDLAFRYWASEHGGVYVPISENTPPNKYLSHLPHRDIDGPKGQKLTLMNPAYMLRQLQEIYGERYGVKGKITSLKPLNPNNSPDAWEREVLRKFENDTSEFSSVSEMNGEPFLRFMKPFVTDESCLVCHGFQGYEVGDIRGGIGISISLNPYKKVREDQESYYFRSIALIWVFGSVVLLSLLFSNRKRITERSISLNKLLDSEKKYRLLVDNQTDMVVKFDLEGKLQFVSPSVCRYLGMKQEDLIGKSFIPFIHEEDRERVTESIKEVFVPPYTTTVEERVNTHKGIRWQSWTNTGVLDDNNNVIEIIAVGRDITEQKGAEESLRKKIEQLDRFNKITVGRELRMIELKNEINELCKKCGLPEKYTNINANDLEIPKTSADQG